MRNILEIVVRITILFLLIPVSSICVSLVLALATGTVGFLKPVMFLEFPLMAVYGLILGLTISSREKWNPFLLIADGIISSLLTYLLVCYLSPGDYVALGFVSAEYFDLRIAVNSVGAILAANAAIALRAYVARQKSGG